MCRFFRASNSEGSEGCGSEKVKVEEEQIALFFVSMTSIDISMTSAPMLSLALAVLFKSITQM